MECCVRVSGQAWARVLLAWNASSHTPGRRSALIGDEGAELHGLGVGPGLGQHVRAAQATLSLHNPIAKFNYRLILQQHIKKFRR